jgi:hypothetical protein
VGFGPEMQPAIFEQSEAIVRLSPSEEFDRGHNMLIDAWITGGVLGVVCLLAVIAFALRAGLIAYRRAPRGSEEGRLAAAVVAAVLAHVIEQAFAFETVVTSSFFWLTIAFACALVPTTNATARISVSSPNRGLAALILLAGIASIPLLLAPAVADGLRGAALLADGADNPMRAAELAEQSARWSPWSAESMLLVASEHQTMAASTDGAAADSANMQAERELRLASELAIWDPSVQLALVRFYVDQVKQPTASVSRTTMTLQRAERVCALALRAGPFRREVWQTCSDVSMLNGQTDEAEQRRQTSSQLPGPAAN